MYFIAMKHAILAVAKTMQRTYNMEMIPVNHIGILWLGLLYEIELDYGD